MPYHGTARFVFRYDFGPYCNDENLKGDTRNITYTLDAYKGFEDLDYAKAHCRNAASEKVNGFAGQCWEVASADYSGLRKSDS